MSGGNYMFMIVANEDTPIYEAEFVNVQRVRPPFTRQHPQASAQALLTCAPRSQREDNSHLNQFIIHAALDMVDDAVWGTNNMLFKCIDRFNDYNISAFVTAGHVRFMLLHDVRNEDGIRNFFHEVHELYVKVLMNPFYEPDTPISSSLFDSRVKTLGRRYF